MLQTNVVLCPVCGSAGELGNGPGGRPRASCRGCGSLERHRALFGLLRGLNEQATHGVLADIAPSPLTTRHLEAMARDAGVPYVGIDFDPAADNRVITVQASLTDLPLRDASVGVMVCFHVLEHIPDDAAALREIRRTLAPGGVAIVQVPFRPDQLTDEDPSVSADERLRRFGQADHVRYYGHDLVQRMESAGLTVHAFVMRDLYGEVETDLFGISPEEPLWLCTAGSPIDVDRLLAACSESARASATQGLERLVRERDDLKRRHSKDVTKLRTKVERAERSRDRAVEREERLRARIDVRVVSAVARRARRLRRRTG